MKDSTLLIIVTILFVAGTVIGIAFFIISPAAGGAQLKYTFLFFITTLLLALLLIVNIYMDMKRLHREHNNIERLLFDIRDGSRKAFEEKRLTERIYGEIGARIYLKDREENCGVLNASPKGALLRCSYDIDQNTLISLRMYLPIFPQPINVKARVLRSVMNEVSRKPPTFDIAVEYTAISAIDKEKLVETIDMLLEKQGNV